MIFCMNCGAKNQDEAHFCKECRKTLYTSEDIYKKKYLNLHRIATITPLIILLIIVLFVILHG